MIDIDSIEEDINRASWVVYNNYGRKFELDDIKQEIALAVMTKASWFDGLNGHLLQERLKIVGYQYVEKERNRYLTFSDQYTYSSNDIRRILGEYYGNESNREEKIDLELSLGELTHSQYKAIEKKYTADTKLSEYERKQVTNGIKTLAFTMNSIRTARYMSEHEGPGARRSITNAHAQAITHGNEGAQ